MSQVDPTSAPGEPDLLDVQELRFLHALQRDIGRVGSLERLAHVALRHVVPHLRAARGALLAPERGGSGPYVVAQTSTGEWDPKLIREIFAAGRAAVPADLLYAVLRERGKSVALLLLSRAQPFTRVELRTLMRADQTQREKDEIPRAPAPLRSLLRADIPLSSSLKISGDESTHDARSRLIATLTREHDGWEQAAGLITSVMRSPVEVGNGVAPW